MTENYRCEALRELGVEIPEEEKDGQDTEEL